ncbi:MAG: hypothetical protein KAJ19_17620, partial [Gammaproteobacteria bacterium]|nr:hypothetical protein [Gammaproteobacteria bacterium]
MDYGQLGGVKITGFISPSDTNDEYAVIDPQLGIGGFRVISGGTSDLDNIPNLRRRKGMVVGVSGGTEYYKLSGDTWSGTFSDWVPFVVGTEPPSGQTFVTTLDGTGTNNYISKWTPDSDTLGNSQIYDNGSQIAFGHTNPQSYLDVNGSVIIRGDITVQGTATTLNTETLLIEDNIITLNSTFTAGTPTLNSGIEVLRGSAATETFLWDELNDT